MVSLQMDLTIHHGGRRFDGPTNYPSDRIDANSVTAAWRFTQAHRSVTERTRHDHACVLVADIGPTRFTATYFFGRWSGQRPSSLVVFSSPTIFTLV